MKSTSRIIFVCVVLAACFIATTYATSIDGAVDTNTNDENPISTTTTIDTTETFANGELTSVNTTSLHQRSSSSSSRREHTLEAHAISRALSSLLAVILLFAALVAIISVYRLCTDEVMRSEYEAISDVEAPPHRLPPPVPAHRMVTTEEDWSMLLHPFEKPHLHDLFFWLNESSSWRVVPGFNTADGSVGAFHMVTSSKTDLWQRTHYGFEADNAHTVCVSLPYTDFVAQVHVETHPQSLYDQAGLLVRYNESCWLKTSVEYLNEKESKMGVVVTNQKWSDWSTQEFHEHETMIGGGKKGKRRGSKASMEMSSENAAAVAALSSSSSSSASTPTVHSYWLRVRREGDDYIVDSSTDGQHWSQIRMCHLEEASRRPIQVGLYACSPHEGGCRAIFSQFTVKRGRVEQKS